MIPSGWKEKPRYRHKILIEEKVASGYGTRGEEIYSWATFAQTWGEVRNLSSREKFNLGQRWPDADAGIEMRFVPNLSVEMRLIDQCCSRTFDIKEVGDPTGMREIQKLTCREMV